MRVSHVLVNNSHHSLERRISRVTMHWMADGRRGRLVLGWCIEYEDAVGRGKDLAF